MKIQKKLIKILLGCFLFLSIFQMALPKMTLAEEINDGTNVTETSEEPQKNTEEKDVLLEDNQIECVDESCNYSDAPSEEVPMDSVTVENNTVEISAFALPATTTTKVTVSVNGAAELVYEGTDPLSEALKYTWNTTKATTGQNVVVNVYPGLYEVAGFDITSGNNLAGLLNFYVVSGSSVKVQGVDEFGNPITNASDTVATVRAASQIIFSSASTNKKPFNNTLFYSDTGSSGPIEISGLKIQAAMTLTSDGVEKEIFRSYYQWQDRGGSLTIKNCDFLAGLVDSATGEIIEGRDQEGTTMTLDRALGAYNKGSVTIQGNIFRNSDIQFNQRNIEAANYNDSTYMNTTLGAILIDSNQFIGTYRDGSDEYRNYGCLRFSSPNGNPFTFSKMTITNNNFSEILGDNPIYIFQDHAGTAATAGYWDGLTIDGSNHYAGYPGYFLDVYLDGVYEETIEVPGTIIENIFESKKNISSTDKAKFDITVNELGSIATTDITKPDYAGFYFRSDLIETSKQLDLRGTTHITLNYTSTPAPTPTPTPAPKIEPTPSVTPPSGRTCQDDGYSAGYVWDENKQVCVLTNQEYVVVEPKADKTVPKNETKEVDITMDTVNLPSATKDTINSEKETPKVINPETSSGDKIQNDKTTVETWALVNLIATVVGLILAIILFIMKKDKEEIEDEKVENYQRKFIYKVVCTLMAIGSLLLFIMTEDMTKTMILFDKYTILTFVFLLLNLISFLIGIQWKHVDK
ncbi:hypothetical protein [Anaerorhabdus sp.]|uniref:hypothetical protein n=1 Tax=Anaerorhabdus sp. TaxID=1872524 RepID=UPI002B1EC2B2|nr:hypothetical protein [Anaerorhabdus sp.]MEA4875543.1 hypothetical protein [Anaerorhabdus sp.]